MNGPTRKRAAARGRRGVPRRLACSLYGEIQRRRPPRDRPALGAVAQPVSHIPRTRGPNGGPQPRFAPEDGVSSWSCTPLKALLPAGKLRDSSHLASPGLTVSAPMVRRGRRFESGRGLSRRPAPAGFFCPAPRTLGFLAPGLEASCKRSSGRAPVQPRPQPFTGTKEGQVAAPLPARQIAPIPFESGRQPLRRRRHGRRRRQRRFTVTLRVSAVDDYSSRVVVAIR
jgi:hypothetical protein